MRGPRCRKTLFFRCWEASGGPWGTQKRWREGSPLGPPARFGNFFPPASKAGSNKQISVIDLCSIVRMID